MYNPIHPSSQRCACISCVISPLTTFLHYLNQLKHKFPQESGMFDMIKTEAASPAASKEEEDEEDEVKIFMVWYYICAAASQNQTHFEFFLSPMSLTFNLQEEEDPLNSSLTPMDWLPRLNAKAGMVEVNIDLSFSSISCFRVTLCLISKNGDWSVLLKNET